MIYIAVFFASTFFAYLASRSRNKCVIILCSAISILIPCILGGLRAHNVGTDTRVYGFHDYSLAAQAPNFWAYLANADRNVMEVSYKFICYIMASTFHHQNACYFAYQLVTVSCIYIGLYKHKDKISMSLALLVWFFMFYGSTYNIMRQCMASAIIFMEFDRLERGEYLKFILAVAVAATFHQSAVIALATVLGMYIVTASQFFRKRVRLNMLLLSMVLIATFFLRPAIGFIVNNFSYLAKYAGYMTSARYSDMDAQKTMLVIFAGELLMLALYNKGADYVLSRNGGGAILQV